MILDTLHDVWHAVWAWLIATPRFLAGIAGGIVAMYLVKDTFPRRLFMVFGAIPSSYYGGDFLTTMFGGNEGLWGFLCGMFATALAKRIFVAIENLDAGSLLGRVIDTAFSVFKGGSK